MNKSLLTNLIAVLCVVAGWLLANSHVTEVGYYALSGAITNWLAIYMLFEKIPFLYGSGVIPARFAEFKEGIQILIMQQFFTEENIQRFVSEQAEQHHIDFEPLLEHLDSDMIYQKLVDGIMQSSFGSMLGMLGGEKALLPMKDSIVSKFKETLVELGSSDAIKEKLSAHLGKGSSGMRDKVANIVEQRLNELTPQMVKMIVQQMIRQHLGWLVVWGGVFGAAIGLVVSFIPA